MHDKSITYSRFANRSGADLATFTLLCRRGSLERNHGLALSGPRASVEHYQPSFSYTPARSIASQSNCGQATGGLVTFSRWPLLTNGR